MLKVMVLKRVNEVRVPRYMVLYNGEKTSVFMMLYKAKKSFFGG
jgi:hypothetical protein